MIHLVVVVSNEQSIMMKPVRVIESFELDAGQVHFDKVSGEVSSQDRPNSDRFALCCPTCSQSRK
jgi:hypothetical protein